jgi:TolB-like protein
MIFRFFTALFTFLFLTACAPMQIQKTKSADIEKKAKIVIIPFYNYTQTPLAGYSAAALSQVILQSHGYKTKAYGLQPDETALFNENQTNRKNLAASFKQKGYRYLLQGEVTEWRYKSGIDAEPVVGLVVTIIDLQNGKTTYSSAGSKTTLGSGSISQAAHNILDEILP